MNVVQVVTMISNRGVFGGPATVALAQSSELRRMGHDATVYALGDDDDLPDIVEGVPVRLFGGHTVVRGLGLLGRHNPRLLSALWKAVGRADVVHVHTGRDLVSLSALAMCRIRRKPYVIQTHGMVMPRSAPLSRVFDLALRPLMRSAYARFVLTDAEQDGLAAVVPGASTTRLLNGVPLPLATTRELSAVPLVSFLARLHPRKRALTFFDAAHALAGRGGPVRFCVYGPDEGDLAQLRRRIADFATRVNGSTLTYEGAVDHAGALRVLAASDVYVLPSVNEPFPMSVLEALAAGTPCVLVDTCGLAGPLAGRGAAIITDGSVEKIAEAVENLLSDPARWRSASADARRAAAELFSVHVVGRQLAACYDAAVDDTGRGRIGAI